MTQEFPQDLDNILKRYSALSAKIAEAIAAGSVDKMDREFEDMACLSMVISSRLIKLKVQSPTG